MTTEEFIKLAKKMVVKETNKHIDPRFDYPVDLNDVFVVWYSKTIQNHKALLGTAIPDKLYFEATYHGDKAELYLDIYKKEGKITKRNVLD